MHYSITRATLWNLAGYAYLLLASFISIPILISHLGVGEFAHYSLLVAGITVASALDLGLPAAVIRALSLPASVPKRQATWTTSLMLFAATGLVVALIATLFMFRLNYSAYVFFLIFLSHLTTHALTLPQANGRFDLFNLKSFLVGTANTFFAAYLASRGLGLTGIFTGQLASYSLTFFLLHLYNRTKLSYSKFSRSTGHSLLSFGLKNQLGKLMNQVESQYAKFLLAPLGALSVSAYSVAQSIVLKLAGSLTQLSTALYPASSRASHSPRLRALYYRLQFGLFALGLLGVGVYYLFGFAFLSWWLHDPTLAGAVHAVLTILVWYLALLILTPLPSVILDSHGRPGLTSLAGTVALGIEVSIAILLLPKFGLLAPAWGALVSLSIMVPVLLYLAERTLTHHSKPQPQSDN